MVGQPWLVVQVGPLRCALPLASVGETLRPLPTTPVHEAPPFVRGMTLLRGVATPVVSLALVLGLPEAPAGRYVTLRAGTRTVALAVDAVLGVRPSDSTDAVPALLGERFAAHLDAVGTVDGDLLVVLSAARVVSAAAWTDGAPS